MVVSSLGLKESSSGERLSFSYKLWANCSPSAHPFPYNNVIDTYDSRE